MIQNKFLDYLVESPLVYYIYNRGSIIYNLQQEDSDIDFLVICDKEFQVPDEYKQYQKKKWATNHTGTVFFENCDFIFKSMDSWFNSVLACEIEAWECACLPKKFIYKEHVKLLMSTDPLKLRNNVDLLMELTPLVALSDFEKGKYHECKKNLWKLIKTYALSNQILENHKIVNFQEVNNEYKQLVLNDSCDDRAILKLWMQLMTPHRDRFNKATDGILAKSKIKKIVQD